jgi:hypothetical protein
MLFMVKTPSFISYIPFFSASPRLCGSDEFIHVWNVGTKKPPGVSSPGAFLILLRAAL